MSILTLDILKRQWVNGDQHIPELIEGIVASSDAVFTKYEVNTPLLVAHMMAQFSEECGQGLEMVENMNYTAARLREIFPTHFTPAMAQRWQHNPRGIADIAYGGRMGNAPPPSDDGWNYRGKGLSQVTGKEGYEKLQDSLTKNGANYSIIEDPDLITDPQHTLECGVADWLICGCKSYAEKDDIVGETRALNGGLNGIVERRRQLRLWKSALKIS
jgi:putative chitinase